MATRAGKVDPQDAHRVKHTRFGIWDLYEERQTDKLGSSILMTYAWIRESSPYAVRMLKDIFSIRRVQILLPIFLIVEVLGSLMPAISLWYSGQLLRLVEPAMETRTGDTTVLVHVAVGHLACAVATRLFKYLRRCIIFPMDISIRQFYAGRTFDSIACLDVPTYAQSVLGRFGIVSSGLHTTMNEHCEIVQILTNITMTVVRLLSQFLVLVTVLREQQDGLLLAILSLSQPIFHWDGTRKAVARSLVWVATTTNEDYVRLDALKRLVNSPHSRKEFVTGNLSEHITPQFHESVQRVGDDAVHFTDLDRIKDNLSVVQILRETMHALPQILFTLRVVQRPMTVSLYLASLVLMYQVSNSFSSPPFSKSPFRQFHSLAKTFTHVRTMYEIDDVRNQVVDGTEPFPEDKQSLRSGISIEFRNVTFQYPGNERYAFQNVSFKIGAGQLCVIVGVNGSGKSTILKLISRMYDPTEGTILIDDRDIKTLKLADLRAAMSILFQDYAHFPVSIRENIGLGNPPLANDDDKIREAARLGGAEEFIDDLPNGFNAFLEGPTHDYYSHLEGFSSFGPPIDFSLVRRVAGIRDIHGLALSGGQMQRLAVSRTFMRSLPSETEPSAGMLLFDEPSASLDPMAEHALFERLRMLRGSKTMIFSTHRFGNLTRHADLILYMDESVQEQGTHDELMRKGGEYARIWNLQAKPFL